MTQAELEDNSNYALERIRTLLDPGRLGSNGRLPTERALSQTFGIGRRAVRRALEVLETEGRVWRRQGSGTFAGAAPLAAQRTLGQIASESNLMEVMEVRMRIEPQLAQLAAMRVAPADVIRLRDILAQLNNATDADGWELWDGAFHRKIAEGSGNKLYIAFYELVGRVRQESRWMNIRERARNSDAQSLYSAQHKQIVDAIASRDPLRAGEAMQTHLLTLHENMIRMMALEPADES